MISSVVVQPPNMDYEISPAVTLLKAIVPGNERTVMSAGKKASHRREGSIQASKSVVMTTRKSGLDVIQTLNSRSALLECSPGTSATSTESQPTCKRMSPAQKKVDWLASDHINTLDDWSTLEPLQRLLINHGHASHMGFQDPSYDVFFNEAGDGALIYKIVDRTAVISGDPICPTDLMCPLVQEFRQVCKRNGHRVAVVGASDEFARLAQRGNFITMRFGTERVINPATNPLLAGRGGKRTVQKSKRLLESGLVVETYIPSLRYDPDIEAKITHIYDHWRMIRNRTHTCQAFVTVYDLFSLSDILTYLIVRNIEQEIIGFAALRRFANRSHLDPVIASPHAPSGTTDLLMMAAFSLTRDAGCTHLSLGLEPLPELEEITGMLGFMAIGMRAIHKRIFCRLPLEGKHAFYQRFHPDEEQDGALHIIFFQQPKLRTALAMLNYANIDLSRVVRRSSTKPGKRIASNGKYNILQTQKEVQ